MTDIDQLSGLALRKALCEALGWKLFHYESGMYATSPEDIADAWNNDGYTLEGWSESKEAWQCQLESDPGVFWPEFEKWARQNARAYSSRWQWSYKEVFSIQPLTLRSSADDPWLQMEGESQLEAGCRAWLKALKEANDGH